MLLGALGTTFGTGGTVFGTEGTTEKNDFFFFVFLDVFEVQTLKSINFFLVPKFFLETGWYPKITKITKKPGTAGTGTETWYQGTKNGE